MVPRVVAIAVRMVMAMCRIFCQIVFASISRLVFSVCFVNVFFLGTDYTDYTDYTDFHILMYTYRSDCLDDTEN